MSAIAEVNFGGGGGRFLFMLMIVATIAFTVAFAIVYSDHAIVRHGADASLIRECFERGGQMEVWKSLIEPNKFYRMCKLDDGRHGIQVLTDKIRECFENTCFVPRDGTYREVVNYLRNFATRYKGEVNW